MSHVVKVSTSFKDLDILRKVCKEKKLVHEIAEPGKTISRKLFDTTVKGVAAVDLPGWQYPVVVAEDGTARLDNYGGSWGKQEVLDDFTQHYARKVTVEQFESQGYRVVDEQVLEDGSLQLQLVN